MCACVLWAYDTTLIDQEAIPSSVMMHGFLDLGKLTWVCNHNIKLNILVGILGSTSAQLIHRDWPGDRWSTWGQEAEWQIMLNSAPTHAYKHDDIYLPNLLKIVNSQS